ncbi:sensor histidine kinase [Streptomyces phyllanthi]|uniref:histidine kinase n=1 Tax=Streptomyces phyllanthi TaxID=1803180 RepID=A0A5N8VT41_9ACTN|nr:sensor histidine kinase [Streptomyces phyllanthi]MPY38407.1 sensor histidine kinase [Streptomyces phyllanthi]
MTSNIERFTERHPHAVDTMAILALFACTALGTSLSLPGADLPRDDRIATLLAAVSCLSLLRARSHPRFAVAVTTVCTVATGALGYLPTPLLLAPLMMALYWFAVRTDSKITRWYGLVIMAMVVSTAILDKPNSDMLLLRTVGPVLWLLLPLVGGGSARMRHDYLQSVHARAAYAERTREEEARLRVAEERMRIARELHDVVAHHMAVAHAQAGTAAHLARTHPEQAQKILADLAGTTSSALLELRATVGVLRHAEDSEAESLEPAPGLSRLPELVAACESAGFAVTVVNEGEVRPLSPGVDLTAYRIIQEALTNATKHASDHAARVRLGYSDTFLTITVTNDGTTVPPTVPGGGYGLMGMRERANSVGGNLRAGPRPEGGFEVATALPIQPYTQANSLAERQEATP